MRDLENGFFEEQLRAAGQGRANGGIFAEFVFVDFQLAIKLRRKRAALVGARGEVTAVEERQTITIRPEKLAKDREIIELPLSAQPLHFVLVEKRPKAQQDGYARVEPAQRIGKLHGAQ